MRAILWVAYAAYLVVLGYLVLSPVPDAAGSGLHLVVETLHRAGFASVTEQWVEVALNVVLFVPLGAGGVLLLGALPWWLWAGVGLALSGSMETIQRFLPARVPSMTDLAANTFGALLGAALTALVVFEVRATRSGRTARPPLVPLRWLVPPLAALGLAVVALVFTPTPALANEPLGEVTGLLRRLGAPDWLSSSRLWERAFNIALFVPAGVAAVLLRPGWSLLRWAAVGFAGSLLIEVVQGAFLPGRDASASDLLMNTTGMVAGAVLARVLAGFLAGVAATLRWARPASRRPGGDRRPPVGVR